jgi:hypothetical protein
MMRQRFRQAMKDHGLVGDCYKGHVLVKLGRCWYIVHNPQFETRQEARHGIDRKIREAKERAMCRVGDAIRDYVGRDNWIATDEYESEYVGEWPQDELEAEIWPEVDITLEEFRQVCANIRNGYSVLGDC